MTKNIVILAFKGEIKEKVSDKYCYNGNRKQTQRGGMDMTKVMAMVILLTVMVVPLSAFADTVQLPATGQSSSCGTNDD